ncbi:DUF4412 domain-containing protein [Elioraea sp.]|uniref:DUF4412 domain-containing protein n=1 Tax=Elioraea sp. TaxID=2185103 RepID=UPI0025BE9339|nr:DUF4412 domain-containing protein [Elioraea sp.]
MRLVIIAAAAASLLPIAATAQPKQPTRDYAITYRMEHQGQAGQMTVAYSAATRRQRVEMPEAGLVVITDQAALRMFMLNAATRTVMEMPLAKGQEPGFVLPDDMVLTRTGSATVAGHRCTIYRAEQNRAERGTVCMTDEGIMLRAAMRQGDLAGSMEATSLTLATQPASQFALPEGWQVMQMPQAPGQRRQR